MKFMVCFDSSKESKKALELARDHAKICGATLEVVNAIMRELAFKHSFVERAERDLETEVNKILEGSEIYFKTNLLIGSIQPEEQMARYAKKEGISQVFIGIQKTSKVGKLVFGSTAQYMILNAHCPVMTVK